MLSIFRWSRRVFISLFVILVVSLTTSYYLIIRSIPEFNAQYSLDGIKDQLEIQTARIYKRLSSSYSNSQKDSGSHELGKKAGKKLNINKGISTKSEKLLGW